MTLSLDALDRLVCVCVCACTYGPPLPLAVCMYRSLRSLDRRSLMRLFRAVTWLSFQQECPGNLVQYSPSLPPPSFPCPTSSILLLPSLSHLSSFCDPLVLPLPSFSLTFTIQLMTFDLLIPLGMTRDDLFNTNASIVQNLVEACAK